MMRVVIQVSMFMAIPLMAVCLYMYTRLAPWYIAYVVMFNMLVGPVFSAGTVTSERERQTLDLLLCTMITPLQILWGKLIAGLRVSSVLTSFLLFPVLLATAMVFVFWSNLASVAAYLSIVAMTCLTTSTLALFCSTCFKKTAMSLMTTYLVILALFCVPLATTYFAKQFFVFPGDAAAATVIAEQLHNGRSHGEIAATLTAASINKPRGGGDWTEEDVGEFMARRRAVAVVTMASVTSPFSATFAVPLDLDDGDSNQTSAPPRRLAAVWRLHGVFQRADLHADGR